MEHLKISGIRSLLYQEPLYKILLRSQRPLHWLYHFNLDLMQLFLQFLQLGGRLRQLPLQLLLVLLGSLLYLLCLLLRLHKVPQNILSIEATLKDLNVPLDDLKFPLQLLQLLPQPLVLFSEFGHATVVQLELGPRVLQLRLIIGPELLLGNGQSQLPISLDVWHEAVEQF